MFVCVTSFCVALFMTSCMMYIVVCLPGHGSIHPSVCVYVCVCVRVCVCVCVCVFVFMWKWKDGERQSVHAHTHTRTATHKPNTKTQKRVENSCDALRVTRIPTTHIHTPATCERGRKESTRSCMPLDVARKSRWYSVAVELKMMLSCEIMTAFGLPVVPDV